MVHNIYIACTFLFALIHVLLLTPTNGSRIYNNVNELCPWARDSWPLQYDTCTNIYMLQLASGEMEFERHYYYYIQNLLIHQDTRRELYTVTL